MNKTFKKAVACTLVAGTVLAGGSLAINTPTEAAVKLLVSKPTNNYNACEKGHTKVLVTGHKSKGAVSITRNKKIYQYEFELKSTSYKKGKVKTDKKGTKTWTETKDFYLYQNGKKTNKVKTITRKATQKKSAKKPTYGSTKTTNYKTMKTYSYNNNGHSFSISYSHTAKGDARITVSTPKKTKGCNCKCGINSRSFNLIDNGISSITLSSENIYCSVKKHKH